jgi:hypothetical protein
MSQLPSLDSVSSPVPSLAGAASAPLPASSEREIALSVAQALRGFERFLCNSGVERERRVSVGRDAEIFHRLGIAAGHRMIGRSCFVPSGRVFSDLDVGAIDLEAAGAALEHLRQVSDDPVLLDVGYRGTLARLLRAANDRLGIVRSLSSVLLVTLRGARAHGWIDLTPAEAGIYQNVIAFESLIKAYGPSAVSYGRRGPVLKEVSYPGHQVAAAEKIRGQVMELYPTVAPARRGDVRDFLHRLVAAPQLWLCERMRDWVYDDVVDGQICTVPLVPSVWRPGRSGYLDVAWPAAGRRLGVIPPGS